MDDDFFKEALECSVCLEQLTCNSKVLPCQHTFCRRCLEEILSSKKRLLCPECRLPVDTPISDLPNNILLARLLEGMRQRREAVKRSAAAQPPVGAERKKEEDLPKGPPPPAGPSGEQEEEKAELVVLAEETFPAKALALYSFSGPEKDDLKFSKGDLLTLVSRVDANWYWAERASGAGLVPANYVQTLCMEKTVPGVALFDFQKDSPSRQYLRFSRGDCVEFLHKMDDNWAFGKCGDSIGLYPLTYVQILPERSGSSPPRQRSVDGNIASSRASGQRPPASPRNRYVALYNYWPKGKDELELFRGHLYAVFEKCPDGWFRGCCVSTGKSGLFPGNYVRPKNASVDNSPAPGSPCLPLSPGTPLASSCPASTPMPGPAQLPGPAPASPARSGGLVAPNSSPVAPPPPQQQQQQQQQQHPGPSRLRFTSPASSGSPASSCAAEMPIAMTQSVPVALPGQSGRKGSSLVEVLTSTPPSGCPVGAPSNCHLPRRLSAEVLELSSSSSPSSSSSALHSLGGHPSLRPNLHPGQAGSMAKSGHSHLDRKPQSCGRKTSNLISRFVRFGGGGSGDRSSGGPGPRPAPNQPVPNSNALASPARSSGSPGKGRFRVYRCVIPYPADSVQELDLAIGDLIILRDQRADGWLYGQLQRNGKLGLFPSSFVELWSKAP